MNHGYCENCWWWEPIKFDVEQAKWVLGVCWMWNSKNENDSYCPDYTNRKTYSKKEGTLEEWVKKLPETFEYPEESELIKKFKP